MNFIKDNEFQRGRPKFIQRSTVEFSKLWDVLLIFYVFTSLLSYEYAESCLQVLTTSNT